MIIDNKHETIGEYFSSLKKDIDRLIQHICSENSNERYRLCIDKMMLDRTSESSKIGIDCIVEWLENSIISSNNKNYETILLNIIGLRTIFNDETIVNMYYGTSK